MPVQFPVVIDQVRLALWAPVLRLRKQVRSQQPRFVPSLHCLSKSPSVPLLHNCSLLGLPSGSAWAPQLALYHLLVSPCFFADASFYLLSLILEMSTLYYLIVAVPRFPGFLTASAADIPSILLVVTVVAPLLLTRTGKRWRRRRRRTRRTRRTKETFYFPVDEDVLLLSWLHRPLRQDVQTVEEEIQENDLCQALRTIQGACCCCRVPPYRCCLFSYGA